MATTSMMSLSMNKSKDIIIVLYSFSWLLLTLDILVYYLGMMNVGMILKMESVFAKCSLGEPF